MVITRSGTTTMRREDLEKFSDAELHDELVKAGIPLHESRHASIDHFLAFYEKKKVPSRAKNADDVAVGGIYTQDKAPSGDIHKGTSDLSLEEKINFIFKMLEEKDRKEEVLPPPNAPSLFYTQQTAPVPNLFFSAAASSPFASVVPNLDYLTAGSSAFFDTASNSHGRIPMPPGFYQSSQASQGPTVTTMQGFPTVSPAQMVNLLVSQLPTFSGTEDDDVDTWIKEVEFVARLHEVNEKVLILAASQKLQKTAREWFDMDPGHIISSWQAFKEALSRRFHRRIPFRETMQKIEARRWNFGRETFQDYAMAKSKLLHPLHLPDRECV
ncbi:uncharacterized protein LOC120359951 [Solenopsis invicta]|uniref:uncharacterized protein LOC120359951 n=1 Tax=Solenopsis invicta TaxID=13686 RepID=UPI00193DF9B4|nr:uncharacterized protein LOC120359951 [Solenopsis invicta]